MISFSFQGCPKGVIIFCGLLQMIKDFRVVFLQPIEKDIVNERIEALIVGARNVAKPNACCPSDIHGIVSKRFAVSRHKNQRPVWDRWASPVPILLYRGLRHDPACCNIKKEHHPSLPALPAPADLAEWLSSVAVPRMPKSFSESTRAAF